MTKPIETDSINYKKMLYISIIFVFTVWASTFILFLFYKPNNVGEIGDMFGMVSSLFTALAFAFLIYTSSLQREELKYQREELVETRKELARTAEAQEKNYELSKRQYDADEKNRIPKLITINERISKISENGGSVKIIKLKVILGRIVLDNITGGDGQTARENKIFINTSTKKKKYKEDDIIEIKVNSDKNINDLFIDMNYKCINDDDHKQRYYWNSDSLH